jgi:hypothetical protein
MIDSDTFLTAAHCTDNFPSGQRFVVSLEQDVLSVLIAGAGLPPDEFIELGLTNGWIVEGDMHRDAGFPANFGFPNSADQHDIAVIDFADRDTTPADLGPSPRPRSSPLASSMRSVPVLSTDTTGGRSAMEHRRRCGAREGSPMPSASCVGRRSSTSPRSAPRGSSWR